MGNVHNQGRSLAFHPGGVCMASIGRFMIRFHGKFPTAHQPVSEVLLY